MHMHMLSIIIRWIGDTIFPPSSDLILVRNARAIDLAVLIAPQNIRGIETLLPFHIPLVRAAIHEAKFHRNHKAFMLLGAALHNRLRQLSHKDALLIPIPLSGSRRRKRGYNQAAEIAKAALQGLEWVALREDVLTRTRNTKPQTKLTKKARL